MKKRLKINYLTILWLAFYIFLLALFLKQSYSYLDPDLGWHLKTGQQIVTTLKLPQTNQINFPVLGQKWIDHEWLSNVIVYEIYSHLGYLALTALFAIIFLSIFVLLNWWLKNKILKEKFHSGLIIFLEIFGAIALSPHIGIRIQMITTLGLLATVIIINNYQNTYRWSKLLWLIPIFYLWANLHAGFFAGFVALTLFWLAKIIEKLLPSLKSPNTLAPNRSLIVVGVAISLLAIASTFVTPYKLELYNFLFGYRDTFYLTHISEWLPQWAYPYIYSQFAYLCLALVFICFSLAAIFGKRNTPLNLWQLLLTIAFWIMAVKSRRHFPLFFVVSLPFLAEALFDYLNLKTVSLAYLEKLFLVIRWLLVSFLLLISIDTIAQTNFVANPFNYFCQDRAKTNPGRHLYPCAATAWLQSHPEYQNYNLLNSFGWGGYLIWIYPEKKLFIDGRAPQAQYHNQSILAEYYDFWDVNKTADKLAEHNIRMVLTKKRPQPTHLSWLAKNFLLISEQEINGQSQRDYLLDYLKLNRNWKLVYQDDLSIIYVKP